VEEGMNKIFVLLIVLIMSGCGYTTRGFIYSDDTIIIDPVVNKIDITSEDREFSGYTSYPRLIENRLTNELVRRFNIDGSLKVVSEDPESLKLTCTINDYTKETLRYTDSDDVEEQRLRLHVHVKLVSSEGKVLKDKVIAGETTYFLSGTRQKSESSAQTDLIEDTARRIIESTSEEW